MILDEPTNGLDPAGIHEVRALMRQLSAERGITVFVSSHLLSEIEQVATHIGIIHHGKLLFQGTPDDMHSRLQEYVSVEVDQPDEAKRLLVASGWAIQASAERRLAVSAHQPADAAAINALLVRAGLSVYRLSLNQPSLEDIFLELTGVQMDLETANRNGQPLERIAQ